MEEYSMTQLSLLNFPHDILIIILNYISNIDDIISLISVCKYIRNILLTEYNGHINIKNFPILFLSSFSKLSINNSIVDGYVSRELIGRFDNACFTSMEHLEHFICKLICDNAILNDNKFKNIHSLGMKCGDLSLILLQSNNEFTLRLSSLPDKLKGKTTSISRELLVLEYIRKLTFSHTRVYNPELDIELLYDNINSVYEVISTEARIHGGIRTIIIKSFFSEAFIVDSIELLIEEDAIPRLEGATDEEFHHIARKQVIDSSTRLFIEDIIGTPDSVVWDLQASKECNTIFEYLLSWINNDLWLKVSQYIKIYVTKEEESSIRDIHNKVSYVNIYYDDYAFTESNRLDYYNPDYNPTINILLITILDCNL